MLDRLRNTARQRATPCRRWSRWPSQLLLLLAMATAEHRREALTTVSSSLASSAMEESGSCGGVGCWREIALGKGLFAGQPLDGDDCSVLELSARDEEDVEGATLAVVHSCQDEDGNVLAQVRGGRAWGCGIMGAWGHVWTCLAYGHEKIGTGLA